MHDNLRWVIEQHTVRTIAKFVSKPVLWWEINELNNQFSLGLLFRFNCKHFVSEQGSACCLDFCKLCSILNLLFFCLAFRRIDGLDSIKSSRFNKLCRGNSWYFLFFSAHRVLLRLYSLRFFIAKELCRSHGHAVLFENLFAAWLLSWVGSLFGMMKIVLAHFLRCEVSGTHLRHY